jgi:predicted GNAT family N-acyltransferase
VDCRRPDATCQTEAVIEQVTRVKILPLRHRILRPGLPVSEAMYPQDTTPGVFHLADCDPDGRVIGCATFIPEDLDGAPAWRLRGMATAEDRRNCGVGGALLQAGLAEIRRRGGNLVWCNGRSTARDFYLRHGFVSQGEEFSPPPQYLPHYVRTLS